jgi:hypothetical protein
MKRRDFITFLGGAVATSSTIWPLAARAQQGGRTRRIGALLNLTSDDQEGQARLAAFQQGLQEWGWTVGRNVQIDYRWGAGDIDRYRQYAEELVALDPDVILTVGGTQVGPLQELSVPCRSYLCRSPPLPRRGRAQIARLISSHTLIGRNRHVSFCFGSRPFSIWTFCYCSSSSAATGAAHGRTKGRAACPC